MDQSLVSDASSRCFTGQVWMRARINFADTSPRNSDSITFRSIRRLRVVLLNDPGPSPYCKVYQAVFSRAESHVPSSWVGPKVTRDNATQIARQNQFHGLLLRDLLCDFRKSSPNYS